MAKDDFFYFFVNLVCRDLCNVCEEMCKRKSGPHKRKGDSEKNQQSPNMNNISDIITATVTMLDIF